MSVIKGKKYIYLKISQVHSELKGKKELPKLAILFRPQNSYINKNKSATKIKNVKN